MKGISSKKIDAQKTEPFAIVAVGAATGGSEAFTELIKFLPHNTGMSYIYLQHADGDGNGETDPVEAFKRASSLTVAEAKEATRLLPNHIYVIPPNRKMMVTDGSLKMSLKPVKTKSFQPINDFFSHLAEEYREKTIGVLLSGNVPDGALGLRTIKAAGGITFAQDSTAEFNGMPRNAIAEDAVDLVLSPQRIAEELAKLADQQERYQQALSELSEDTINDRDENLINIIRQIHRLTGVDFSHYKINTIKRRIIRRMIIHDKDTLESYVQFLKQNASEVQQLYQDLLINVTTFFRDADATEFLKKSLLPRIIQQKETGEPVRIWIPACSTGQEAYSFAILMMELLGERVATTDVQIFATDLSESAVNKARLGIYTKDEVADVSAQRLNRFFNKIDGSYRIIRSIRDICVFATHNVLKDPPFSRLDLVSCCNLLIYLEPMLQKKIMTTFHYSLNNAGYLVLGKSETIGTSANLFTQVEKKYKIYVKKKDAVSKAFFEMTFRGPEAEKEMRQPILPKMKHEDFDLDKMVDRALLKKYTPPSVVVSQDLEIVQFRGSTGLFLEPTPGKASLNLMKMARPGLGFELRNLVFKATKSGETETKFWDENLPEDKVKRISIEAVPIKHQGDSIEKYFLITFNEQLLEIKEVVSGDATKDQRVKQLEDELSSMREDMRTLVEEQEAANEELQSVNEEIVSSNEELQSINEELETSKEELESSNEELLTINQELQMRNEQLAEIQEYSEAIYTTIRESLLILDKNLRIKNANLTFYKTFRVTEEETHGKLLYEVGSHQWDIPKLRELLEDIIPRNSHVADYEVVHKFPRIGEKVMMLNARRLVRKLHAEHLILLALEDITEFRHAQELIAEKEAWFRKMADQSPMMLWVANADKKLEFVNEAWAEYRDVSKEEMIGKDWIEEMHADDENKVRKVMDTAFEKKKEFSLQYRMNKGNDYKLILSKGKPNYSPDGRFIGFIGSCVEIPPSDNQ
ncbi:MAG: PAS domain S-box protein [Chitinophagaceae bacterium]|nr:MAG: PAS domain S-box protein [Chitinophagaceae bacterium]